MSWPTGWRRKSWLAGVMLEFISAVTSPDFEAPAVKVVLALEAEEEAARTKNETNASVKTTAKQLL
jgi:hypothetical protein